MIPRIAAYRRWMLVAENAKATAPYQMNVFAKTIPTAASFTQGGASGLRKTEKTLPK